MVRLHETQANLSFPHAVVSGGPGFMFSTWWVAWSMGPSLSHIGIHLPFRTPCSVPKPWWGLWLNTPIVCILEMELPELLSSWLAQSLMRDSLEWRWKSHQCLDEWSSRATVTWERSTRASPVVKGDERERKGRGQRGRWVVLACRGSGRQHSWGGFGEGMDGV